MSPVLDQETERVWALTSPSPWDTNVPVPSQDQQIFQVCLGMELGTWG